MNAWGYGAVFGFFLGFAVGAAVIMLLPEPVPPMDRVSDDEEEW